MSFEFEKKVALVTGGNSGMGKAAAVAFAQAGARVVIAARNETNGQKTAAIIRKAGGDCLYVRTDVSRSEDVKALVQKTIDTYGRLDYAVNNAGVETEKDFLDYTEEDWDRTIDINLKGIWLCMMNEIPQMLKLGRGAIVNVSSTAGLNAIPRYSAYIASKNAVLGLTKSASLEFAGRGIRVNSICPGAIVTPMLKRGLAAHPDNADRTMAAIPMGRLGQPEEFAAAALWLCSDKSSFVTGVTLGVDGGQTQH